MLVNLGILLSVFALLQCSHSAKQSKLVKSSQGITTPSKFKIPEVSGNRAKPAVIEKSDKNTISQSETKPGAVLFQSKASENLQQLKPGDKIASSEVSKVPQQQPSSKSNQMAEKTGSLNKLAFSTPFGDADLEDDEDILLPAGKVIFASKVTNQSQSIDTAPVAQQRPPEGKIIFSSPAPKAVEQKIIFISPAQKRPDVPAANEKIIDSAIPAEPTQEKIVQLNEMSSSDSNILPLINQNPAGAPVAKPKKLRSLEESLIEALEFEPNYTGPRIDLQFNVTMTFVKDTLIPYLKSGGLLDRKSAYSLFYRAFLEFSVEDTLEDIWLEKDDNLVVFGDIHGQLHDFLQVIDHEGYPRADLKYLFNGDIVDRGAYSVECLLILLAMKVAEPDNVFVSLGNHETFTVGKLQFFKESLKKYGNDEFFRLAHILFKSFPVSFLLEDEVFITHGGLSPFLRLERIRMINRLSPSHEDIDIINDLTWSDPVQNYGIFESQRGLGYLFGPDITKDFLKFNNISAIIRSHQYKETGYSEQHDGLCITVFSCPNYRGAMKNLGAYLKINKNLDMEMKNFVAASTIQGNESPIQSGPKNIRNLRRDKSKPLDLPVPQK